MRKLYRDLSKQQGFLVLEEKTNIYLSSSEKITLKLIENASEDEKIDLSLNYLI